MVSGTLFKLTVLYSLKLLFLGAFLSLATVNMASAKELLTNDRYIVEIDSGWCGVEAVLSVKDKATGNVLPNIPEDLKGVLKGILQFECPSALTLRAKKMATSPRGRRGARQPQEIVIQKTAAPEINYTEYASEIFLDAQIIPSAQNIGKIGALGKYGIAFGAGLRTGDTITSFKLTDAGARECLTLQCAQSEMRRKPEQTAIIKFIDPLSNREGQYRIGRYPVDDIPNGTKIRPRSVRADYEAFGYQQAAFQNGRTIYGAGYKPDACDGTDFKNLSRHYAVTMQYSDIKLHLPDLELVQALGGLKKELQGLYRGQQGLYEDNLKKIARLEAIVNRQIRVKRSIRKQAAQALPALKADPKGIGEYYEMTLQYRSLVSEFQWQATQRIHSIPDTNLGIDVINNLSAYLSKYFSCFEDVFYAYAPPEIQALHWTESRHGLIERNEEELNSVLSNAAIARMSKPHEVYRAMARKIQTVAELEFFEEEAFQSNATKGALKQIGVVKIYEDKKDILVDAPRRRAKAAKRAVEVAAAKERSGLKDRLCDHRNDASGYCRFFATLIKKPNSLSPTPSLTKEEKGYLNKLKIDGRKVSDAVLALSPIRCRPGKSNYVGLYPPIWIGDDPDDCSADYAEGLRRHKESLPPFQYSASAFKTECDKFLNRDMCKCMAPIGRSFFTEDSYKLFLASPRAFARYVEVSSPEAAQLGYDTPLDNVMNTINSDGHPLMQLFMGLVKITIKNNMSDYGQPASIGKRCWVATYADYVQ